MLDDKKSRECTKCYDQEKSGFFSLRLSSNKHFGHNIGLVDSTQPDGTADLCNESIGIYVFQTYVIWLVEVVVLGLVQTGMKIIKNLQV